MLKPDYSNSYAKFWETGERIGHGGWDPGVTTGMYYIPEDQLGIIIFVNSSSYKNITELGRIVHDNGKSILKKTDNFRE